MLMAKNQEFSQYKIVSSPQEYIAATNNTEVRITSLKTSDQGKPHMAESIDVNRTFNKMTTVDNIKEKKKTN